MKAKVTLTDDYTGRSINLICDVENIANVGEKDKYEYNPEYLSDGQHFSAKWRLITPHLKSLS